MYIEKTRGRERKADFLYNLIYQAIMTASPLVLTPKLSRVFGVEYQGIKSYTFSIVYYFAIFGLLGLDMYGQRQIAIERDDINSRNNSFWNVTLAKVLLSCVSTVVYLIVIQSEYVSRTGFEKVVFYCWVLYLLREMINPAFFLQGMGLYKVLSLLGILSQISYLFCSFVFINSKEDLPLYVIFYSGIPLLISLYYYKTVIKYIKHPFFSFSGSVNSIRKSIVYFVPTVAAAVYSMVDKTMLGFFDTSKMSTGLYEASEKMVKVALAISTASFTIIRTRMTYLHANSDKDTFSDSVNKYSSFTMMLCWPILFGIIGIANDFVPVFFGPGYEDVIPLSYFFVAVIPCLTISGLLQAIFIIPYGLQKSMDIYYGIIVCINVVMNCILIPHFGTVGAVIASVIAELLLAVVLLVKAKKEINIKHVFTCSIKYIIASFVMLIVILFVSNNYNNNSITKLIIEFLAAVATYFVVCLLLHDSFLLSQMKTVIKKIIRHE